MMTITMMVAAATNIFDTNNNQDVTTLETKIQMPNPMPPTLTKNLASATEVQPIISF